MYNLDFIVKYKSIEEDLIKKIEEGENMYSKEDVYTICEELYRHELLSVLYVDHLDDIKLNTSITDTWKKIKNNSHFLTIFELYKKKIYINYHLIEDEYIFTEMFNYHLFYLIHPIIRNILQNTEDIFKIEPNNISLLKVKINSL